MNRVMLIGHLGQDPSSRYTPTGKLVVKVSMATNESWKGENGEKQTRTDWHNLEVWGRLAEVAQEYWTKGKQLYIEGKIKTDKYEDESGQTKYYTKIVVSSFEFLGGRGNGDNAPTEAYDTPETTVPVEDELPF